MMAKETVPAAGRRYSWESGRFAPDGRYAVRLYPTSLHVPRALRRFCEYLSRFSI
jgi:hypothetical protein